MRIARITLKLLKHSLRGANIYTFKQYLWQEWEDPLFLIFCVPEVHVSNAMRAARSPAAHCGYAISSGHEVQLKGQDSSQSEPHGKPCSKPLRWNAAAHLPVRDMDDMEPYF